MGIQSLRSNCLEVLTNVRLQKSNLGAGIYMRLQQVTHVKQKATAICVHNAKSYESYRSEKGR